MRRMVPLVPGVPYPQIPRNFINLTAWKPVLTFEAAGSTGSGDADEEPAGDDDAEKKKMEAEPFAPLGDPVKPFGPVGG